MWRGVLDRSLKIQRRIAEGISVKKRHERRKMGVEEWFQMELKGQISVFFGGGTYDPSTSGPGPFRRRMVCAMLTITDACLEKRNWGNRITAKWNLRTAFRTRYWSDNLLILRPPNACINCNDSHSKKQLFIVFHLSCICVEAA